MGIEPIMRDYTLAEARMAFEGHDLAATPRLPGNALEQWMWLKRAYRRMPFRHSVMFPYCYLWRAACGQVFSWRASGSWCSA